MQTSPRPIFSQSVDWRFLLPISENAKILLIGRNLNDTVDGLKQVGIHTVTIGSLPLLMDLMTQSLASFDVVAIPHGILIPGPLDDINQLLLFQTIRQLIRPGGVFMIGFANSWKRRSDISVARPGRFQKLLHQSGFSTMDLYGVYPDLMIPEYIIPMQSRILSFAFQTHWRNKMPDLLLRVLSSRLILNRLRDFLPFYFLVAGI